ncbi:MAG: hypothetical protein AAF547_03945 [Actinomycetota bacterium]
MFKLIRSVKAPFGEAGGAIARETAKALGANTSTVAKVEKIGRCAGRLGAGAMLPVALDPLGDIEDAIDAVDTFLDL